MCNLRMYESSQRAQSLHCSSFSLLHTCIARTACIHALVSLCIHTWSGNSMCTMVPVTFDSSAALVSGSAERAGVQVSLTISSKKEACYLACVWCAHSMPVRVFVSRTRPLARSFSLSLCVSRSASLALVFHPALLFALARSLVHALLCMLLLAFLPTIRKSPRCAQTTFENFAGSQYSDTLLSALSHSIVLPPRDRTSRTCACRGSERTQAAASACARLICRSTARVGGEGRA